MKSLDPKVIVIFFIKNLLGTIYIFPVWFIAVFLLEQLWTANLGIVPKDVVILLLDGAGYIFFVLLMLGCYYWALFTFLNFGYELQQDGLHIRSGIFIRRYVIIPYPDIETVDVLVNPLVVRFLQLCTVRIKSRERINTEGVFQKKQVQLIPGLTDESARFLRPELFKYSHIQSVKKTFSTPLVSE